MTTFLVLSAACPRCQKRPTWRISAREQERYQSDHPDVPVGNYKCHRCGTVYPLTAGDYQRAA